MKSKKQPSNHVAATSKPQKTPVSSEPQLVIPKRPLIAPASDEDVSLAAAFKVKPEGKDIQPAVATTTLAEEVPTPEATAEAAPAFAEDPETVTNTPQATVETAYPTDDAEDLNDATDPKSGKMSPGVRKALEEAKREKEVQQFIENRDFFVPINAAARKRSIKVSGGLVLIELLLGLLLINLMLDAGIIEMLDKIPHTHFFNIH